MMENTVLAGARLFDGERFFDRHALVVEGGRVKAIVPEAEVSGKVTRLEGGILAPGFVDVQVNGGGGRLLNNDPTPETFFVVARAHRTFGTTALLPTLVTDTREVTRKAVEAAVEAAKADEGVLGIHLEGPHLAPARRGAHLAELMRPVDDVDLDLLCRAAGGMPVLHITVAAEQVTPQQVERLANAGVVVSLGHTDCTSEDARRLFNAGARGITHLYNAMSGLTHRAPGLVGAALDAGDVWGGIIADGHHVDPAALRIALRAKRGPGRLFHVTDAMALVGSNAESFELNGRTVRREPGEVCSKLVLEDGTLAGSDLDMASGVRFGVQVLELPVEESLRMASAYPATYLGIEKERGFLKLGCRADCIHLTDDLRVQQAWISGRVR
ncbi:N-acetylglucosamine-6-phosphate deacetylase [Chelativorans sp. AA-79]|uniref:N-acetylglucosamine-6-phosphate deacetylase n=1 Tax=Chelativorans sp. AA-79 TaxID=3028735 RepID=UPI0023F8C841|nr:N-acetylglucosamine-6-phosphate deacetylase [Chelativorans sp. AA-79]WEX11790.1 N-acetylglucosamine-6-phosphate deacetylase [Chelativorans sp. AA-79]